MSTTTNMAFLSGMVLSMAILADAQNLYQVPDGVFTRWASPENPNGESGRGAQANGGRKGAPAVSLKANAELVLAHSEGVSGTVRRIWITLSDRSPAMLRGLKIEMFWDGSKRPAVSAPLGDFFAFGSGRMAAFQSALFSSPEGKSFDCVIPMPFKTGMKIVVKNESEKDLQLLFYDVDYTLGDKHGKEDLYFHAHFFHQNPTELRHDFEVLPEIEGKGRFMGASFGVRANLKTLWAQLVGRRRGQNLCRRRPCLTHFGRHWNRRLRREWVGVGSVLSSLPGRSLYR